MGDVMVASTPVWEHQVPDPPTKRRTAPNCAKGKNDFPLCCRSGRTTGLPILRIAQARGWCFSCLGDHYQRACPDTHPCPVLQRAALETAVCANANGRRDHAGSPFGRVSPRSGYVSGRRDQSRSFESGSPPPRCADCVAVDRRHGSAVQPHGLVCEWTPGPVRSLESRSPPLPSRDQSRSPRGRVPTITVMQVRYDCHPPPLAERPRLESRNPRYGRSRGYKPPTMARGSRHRGEAEFKPFPLSDAPSRHCGVRSPPRKH
ncbi:unnamed protein product, partial [Brenthis ino]